MVAALFQQRLDSPLVRGIPGSPRGETAAMSGWHPITTPIPVLPREGADIVSVPAAALRRALDEAMRVMTAVEARLDQALTGVFPDHLRAPAIDLMLNGYNGRYDELRENVIAARRLVYPIKRTGRGTAQSPPALFAPSRNRLSVRAFSEISMSKGTTMDPENSNRAAEEHSQAEDKLEKAEGQIRKALDELKDLSGSPEGADRRREGAGRIPRRRRPARRHRRSVAQAERTLRRVKEPLLPLPEKLTRGAG